MPEVSTIARADELQILLNILADSGGPLTVSYPFYNLPILTYDPRKGAVVSSVSEDDFLAAASRHAPKTARLEQDLPQWGDVRDALLSAGILPYANEGAASERLAKALDRAGDAHNPNPTFLAFDTNTLYHRLPTRGLGRVVSGDTAPFQLAVSEAVVAELDAAVANKYTEVDITSLRSKVAENRSAAALLGRPYKQGRRAKMALTDVRLIEKQRRALRCRADATSADKEKNDRVIAASYRQLRDTARADVIFLTADHDMQEHALAAGLTPLVLQLPRTRPIPTGPMDERDFCRLIHELAIAWGALRFVGADAWAWGIWSGKEPHHWDTDALQLDHGDGDIMRRFRADHHASSQIEAIARGE